jgi:4-hydroxybenzoyl-CoA thioesterase
MVVIERPVRFEDVDAAGIVFFGNFLRYGHEAMEALFKGADGGYVGLITRRRIGFPAVKVVAEYKAPLRYGDVVRIAVTAPRVGTTSATLRYEMTRKSDGAHVATIEHVVVCSDLGTITKMPLPQDCRAVLAAHAR